MLINIEDVNIGDELLISVNSRIAYLKILRKPELSKTKNWRGQPKYKAVKASCRIDEIVHQYGNGRTYTQRVQTPTDKDHNVIKNFNLNERALWLIKKAEI